MTLAGVLVFAWLNARLGRGDARTALRLGLYLTGVRLLWLPGAHHIPTSAEIDLFRSHLAYAGYRLILVYLFYLALEPYARRLWPQMLVSWVRIFDGRLRDARVGRDLLLGVAFGAALAVAAPSVTGVMQLTEAPGFPLQTDFWSWEALRGPGSALASLAGIHATNVIDAFMPIMLFLILRILLRRTWAAAALVTIAGFLMFNPGPQAIWPFLISFAVLAGLFWWSLLRAGLLTAVLGFTVENLLTTPRLTADLTAWHALPMWLAYGSVLALTLWGLLAATGGQRLFRDEIQDRA